MVIDCFTFNGETQILKLHLGILYDYVDKFIIVEANKTFTGKDKPLYFFRDQRYFQPWWPKIEYYVMDQWDNMKLWEQAIRSPNTQGAEHWKREFYIKESIHIPLKKYAKPEDVVLIGDVDEIINPTVQFESEKPVKAKLRVYNYWLNNRSSEPFWGTLMAQYKDIEGKCLNHLRSDTSLYSQGDYLGWHFTNMAGEDEIRRKLDDSYTEESYNTLEVQRNLADRIKQNKDYLGRDFTFTLDETDWPEYLTINKNKFKNLIKYV